VELRDGGMTWGKILTVVTERYPDEGFGVARNLSHRYRNTTEYLAKVAAAPQEQQQQQQEDEEE
jgi:hypothetical protein